jgi:hypothetical protein
MKPRRATQATALNPVEMRLTGGMSALNRLIMTFQNKRMPVVGLAVGRDGGGMRATVVLDCPPETARRYAALLSGLEDAEGIEVPEETLEIALLETDSDGWRELAARVGIEAHEQGGTVVASGEPEGIEAWLGSLGDKARDVVRLGPVARPGDGG